MSNHDYYEYKGYCIRLKFSFNHGGGYQIIKRVKGKWFVILERNFTFVKPQVAIDRATAMIDTREEMISEKFKVMFTEFCAKVAAKPKNYETSGIDVIYYLKCNKKLNSQIK